MAKKSKRTSAQKRDTGDFERSYRKMTGGKYKKKRKTGQKIGSFITILVAVLVLCLVVAGGLYVYNNQKGVFPAGVTIAGVDVSGMTQSEAVRAVEGATKNTYSTTPMIVTVLEDQCSIDPATSKVSLNVQKAVNAAFKSSRAGKPIDITPYLSVDENAVRSVLAELGKKYSSTLAQSTYEVVGSNSEQELIVHLGSPEYGLDMNLLYQHVIEKYCNNLFAVEGVCEIIDPKEIDLQGILDKHYIAPKDAYFNKETKEFVAGVDGYGFDVEQAKKSIADADYNSTVKIPFTAVTSAYKDILGSCTAEDATSDHDRNTNLRLACAAIHGTVINPGETFSFNNVVGEPTEAKGYRPGLTYSEGMEVRVIGGGISQVASALYNCAMLADLEIITRSAHDFAVSYVPLGMDADVNWNAKDFSFKNTTDRPISIQAISDEDITYVMLCGTDDRDYYIKLRHEVLATYTAETTYEEHDPQNAEGYQNGDTIIKPHTGYKVQTYREKYSKKTNERIETVKETRTDYAKQDHVVCKISGTNTEETKPGIGNGGVTEDGSLPD